MTVVVIDDERDLDVGWDIWIKNGQEACHFIQKLYNKPSWKTPPITLYLDHDLGDADKPTGYDVARMIEEHEHSRHFYADAPARSYISDIFVHSMNPVGARRIMQATSKWIPTKLVSLDKIGIRNT